MNLENYLFDDLSKENHQSYIQSRQQQGMNYIADYNEWLSKNSELEKLIARNNADTWENSEHNPTNYPDWNGLDNDTKEKRITQGKQDYWTDSEALEAKIRELRHLLTHPDEFIRDTDSENDSEPTEYWTVND